MDSSTMLLIHTAITIVGIVALIVGTKMNPVIVLVLGALYLGVAGGLGVEGTTTAVATGFGNLMAEVGLVIGFGVLLGAMLAATGTLQRVVDAMLRLVGAKRSSYALGLSTGIIFPAIYFDVMLVMVSPIARRIAARTGLSIAPLAAAMAVGLPAGLLMVVPGAAALAAAATLEIPLGLMLLWGAPFALVAIIISVFLNTLILNRTWNPDKDEEPFEDPTHEKHTPGGEMGRVDGADPVAGPTGSGGIATLTQQRVRQLPLIVAVFPILIPVVLIVANTLSTALGADLDFISFLGHPIVALLIGLLIAVGMALPSLGRDGVEEVISRGAGTSGVILLFTGVAGSLGQVLAEVGIAELLAGLFSANAAIPLLLAWIVAALLRLAQGSASVSLITAAALLAPVAGDLGAPGILIALAAAGGASFGGQVTDNSFWMFKTLIGLSTRGTFQVYTLAQSLFSVVSLALVLVIGIFA